MNSKSKITHGRYFEQEAQLPQRDRATRYISKFVLCFTRYGNYKSFKQLVFDTDYLCAKLDDCCFSRSSDIVGAQKFKVGHVTHVILTTPILRVLCYSYAGT